MLEAAVEPWAGQPFGREGEEKGVPHTFARRKSLPRAPLALKPDSVGEENIIMPHTHGRGH